MKESNIARPHVELISYTQDPEFVVASAARLCYAGCDIDELLDKQTPAFVSTFIEKLHSMHHYSPFEHASFTFGIEGVSRAFLAQVTRHRIASFSVQSQRYVDLSDWPSYIVPPEIEELGDSELAEYQEIMDYAWQGYWALGTMLTDKYKKQGMDENAAKKKALEDARFALPNACETKMMMTMNARELLHFFNLRCCSRAQWEIRAIANEMVKLCKKVAPSLFRYAGPSCVSGPCPEGEKSCKKGGA